MAAGAGADAGKGGGQRVWPDRQETRKQRGQKTNVRRGRRDERGRPLVGHSQDNYQQRQMQRRRPGCCAKSCGATSMMTAGMRSTMGVEASLRNMIFGIGSPEAQCPLLVGS
jgi:hypothetical protein